MNSGQTGVANHKDVTKIEVIGRWVIIMPT